MKFAFAPSENDNNATVMMMIPSMKIHPTPGNWVALKALQTVLCRMIRAKKMKLKLLIKSLTFDFDILSPEEPKFN